MVVGGQDFFQAHFAAHIIDGLFEEFEALATGRAGLHGTGQVELFQELLQLFVQRQVLPVGWYK